MNQKIFEFKNTLNNEQKKFIDNYVLTNNFPWYFQDSSTTDKFQYFSHMLLPRIENFNENAPEHENYNFFKNILLNSCNLANLKVKKILRSCLNLTTNCFKNEYIHGDVHTDYPFPHKLGIIYLNDCKGDTFIFNETHNSFKVYDNTYLIDDFLKKPITILKRIKPEKYKVLIFDGEHYHATGYCDKHERRVICVFNFTTYDKNET
jgi:hypothetical protein